MNLKIPPIVPCGFFNSQIEFKFFSQNQVETVLTADRTLSVSACLWLGLLPSSNWVNSSSVEHPNTRALFQKAPTEKINYGILTDNVTEVRARDINHRLCSSRLLHELFHHGRRITLTYTYIYLDHTVSSTRVFIIGRGGSERERNNHKHLR